LNNAHAASGTATLVTGGQNKNLYGTLPAPWHATIANIHSRSFMAEFLDTPLSRPPIFRIAPITD